MYKYQCNKNAISNELKFALHTSEWIYRNRYVEEPKTKMSHNWIQKVPENNKYLISLG